jgi:hypothetical protein
MTLTAGTKLGSYEVLSQIGAGGMGEVYQAHDTKLGRDVAIKVLPEAFAHDPKRLSRFQREAKMLASLNHPNIATIFGLEQSGDTSCLVMELVSGETLAERVKEGLLAIEEALKIAVQIAEAPKSSNLTLPSGVTFTLAGIRSRWMIFFSWALPLSSFPVCPRFLRPRPGFSCPYSPSLVERRELCRYTSGSAVVARLAPCPTCFPSLPTRYALGVGERCG